MAKKARRRGRGGIVTWAAIGAAMMVAVGLLDHATSTARQVGIGDLKCVAAK
jgi:hypothetical protein